MILSRTQRQKLNDGAKASRALPHERVVRESERRVPYLLAKITDSFPIIGTTNRWQYWWTRAEHLNDPTKTMQEVASEPWYNGIAYNVAEGGNTASLVCPGYTVANIPAGFSVKPVQGYVLLFPHRLTDGTERWLFCVPNAIDGTCP